MTKEDGICPFAWNDRVDHHKFGLGTVNGEPQAVVGPKAGFSGGVEPKGWRVPVLWDDTERGETSVSSKHLRVVRIADARGAPYWRVRYDRIAERLAECRKKTDRAIESGFRPAGGSGLEPLLDALENEKIILNELTGFLEADSNGEHP